MPRVGSGCEHSVTTPNQEADEEIRWLPSHHLPDDIVLPADGNDWWLFDDELVTVGHFHKDGRVKGSELITDPGVVAGCGRARNRPWSIAAPHNEYELFRPVSSQAQRPMSRLRRPTTGLWTGRETPLYRHGSADIRYVARERVG